MKNTGQKNEVSNEAKLKAKIEKLEKKNRELVEANKQMASRVEKLTETMHAHYFVNNMETHNERVRYRFNNACNLLDSGITRLLMNMPTHLDTQQAFGPDEWAMMAELEVSIKQFIEHLEQLKKSRFTQVVEG